MYGMISSWQIKFGSLKLWYAVIYESDKQFELGHWDARIF